MPFAESVEFISNHLKVERAGTSNAVTVSFVSSNPERSAQIANAIVEAYFEQQAKERDETTREANRWLQNRIRELRQRSIDANQAVADFKSKNNILQSSKGSLTEQQTSQLSTRLEAARTLTSEAQARLRPNKPSSAFR